MAGNAPHISYAVCLWSGGRRADSVIKCPAYSSLRAKYGRGLGFQGRSMRTIMIEAPQLALASFLSEIWEARYAALRRIALAQRTREGDDDPPRHRSKSKQLAMAPAGAQRTPSHSCSTCSL
jgi:hypothetical protein